MSDAEKTQAAIERLEADLARERARVEQLTWERDEARFVIENMYNTIKRLQHERDAAVSNLAAKDCAYRGACMDAERLGRERNYARAARDEALAEVERLKNGLKAGIALIQARAAMEDL